MLGNRNPIQDWEHLKGIEVREGGDPKLCIIGSEDYAILCGAIAIMSGVDEFGSSDWVEFRGVRLFKSHAHKWGVMFA